MTIEQLDRAREIRLKLSDLTNAKERAQYALDYLEVDNEKARSYLRLISPSNSSKSLEIKEISLLKEFISGYIARVETQIEQLEQEFEQL